MRLGFAHPPAPATPGVWQASSKLRERSAMAKPRLPELGAKYRRRHSAARLVGDKRCNVAFLWSAEQRAKLDSSQRPICQTTTATGKPIGMIAPRLNFQPAVHCGDLSLGLMICTEIWFMQHAREYGTTRHSFAAQSPQHASRDIQTSKWLAGGRAAAVVVGRLLLYRRIMPVKRMTLNWAGPAGSVTPTA